MRGLPDRGDLIQGWPGIDVLGLFGEFDGNRFANFDCVKQCVGSDGQVYDQPVASTDETTKNAYAMMDFNQDLPAGLRFTGNAGMRLVQNDVLANGRLTDEAAVQGCRGRVGNPALKPFTGWNHNVSLEWFPNRDTVVSIAYHKLNAVIGSPEEATIQQRLFEGSDRADEIEPITGERLGDIVFDVPTYVNGPGFKRHGWEFQAKTAFTFLPWLLRHTGADFNISTNKSNQELGGVRDPNTGDVMPQANEAKYSTNLSVWYDDDRLNARVAYQRKTAVFRDITPGLGGNTVNWNYPGVGYGNSRVTENVPALAGPGYYPGHPRFEDAASFIDAKVSYNITPNFQIYGEGRNLLKATRTFSAGDYVQFADGSPRVLSLAYSGYRLLFGAVAKFGVQQRRR